MSDDVEAVLGCPSSIEDNQIITKRSRDRQSFLRSIGTAFVSTLAVVGAATPAKAASDSKIRDEDTAKIGDPKLADRADVDRTRIADRKPHGDAD